VKQKAFQALLAEFFQVAGCGDSESLPGMGRGRCHGREVALYYDDRIDPSNIHGYVDLGIVAPARQGEVFRSLLLHNPSFRQEHSAVLGLDAESDRIVLVARIAFQEALNGERLAAILAHWIQKVFVMQEPKRPVRVGTGKGRPQTLRLVS
jgi:hypothetical protein